MATPPDQTRAALLTVATAASAEVAAVAAQAAATGPTEARAALFAAVPLIVESYSVGSSALALDWYEELRDEANPRRPFRPQIVPTFDDDALAAIVAQSTNPLRDLEREFARQADRLGEEMTRALDESLTLLTPQVETLVADGFRETVTENVKADPDAVGWKRHARPEACKFCLMLAARGAVYTEETARFAAHGAVTNGKTTGGNCMCIAGPAFGGKEIWAEATPMQYVASQRTRTPEQQAALRDYLNENFPDAPG